MNVWAINRRLVIINNISVKSMLKRLGKAYLKNIFDGKITTLVGAILIGVGLHHAFQGHEYLEIIEWIGAGLVLMGLPDPRQKKSDP